MAEPIHETSTILALIISITTEQKLIDFTNQTMVALLGKDHLF